MYTPPPVLLTGDSDERNRHSEKFVHGSLTTITVYHDPLCPWCWVGLFQAQRLTREFGVKFDWRGAELVPPEMAHDATPKSPVDSNAAPEPPRPPSRFALFAQAEGVEMPAPRPPFTRTHNALLGAEFARLSGPAAFDAYNEAVYRAFWERHEDIADLAVLTGLAQSAGLNGAAFVRSVESEEFAGNILPFDDTAYAFGIRHVPTFIFNAEERLAEAPYADLARATERFLIRAEKFKGK